MIDITYGAAPSEKTAVALGYFDGLHSGHVFVISCALNEKFAPAVFTFNCDTTLPKFQSPEDIISFENKCELLDKMGVKYLYAPDFAEVCGLSDEDFVKEILVKRLNAAFACCGRNFRFGKNACGTPERLAEIGKKYGITVKIAEDVCLDGELISSTHIRELIRKGEIEAANRLLGYELMFNLPVVYGNQLGRTIDFPTINQVIPETNIIPRFGAYKSYVQVHGKNYRGITNIGVRPTVGDNTKVVMETHIVGFSGNLYGERIAVSLVKFLREERKFADLNELKKQLKEDLKK